ncbi:MULTISPECIES: ATP-binding protein [Thermomonosporaceae]|uniref:ATP-binding protein n=1 Tax=Thermomonosporaceae TaxID=2012 RepID=UPI00255AE123|nr:MULTISPECIES: ATP-binding protein [Thermomonosporaceae]MDL4772651.1 ATP-binding protein [Actinomadura xylanilytica]
MTVQAMLGSVTLPGAPESVGHARRFALDVLDSDARADTAELLVSEACTNSVRHSRSRFGGTITLTLHEAEGVLRCEVVDDGAATRPVARTGDELREHGYGVMLIETLADRFGHFMGDEGRLHTWFELG